MSKAVRNLLILGSVLLIVGGIIATVGTVMGGMRPVYPTRDGLVILGIGSADYVDVNEKYNSITEVYIDSDIMDLWLVEGTSFSLKGRYNSSIMSLDVSEKNGVLTIKAKNLKNGWWGFDWWGFNWWGLGSIGQSSQELTLTYPKGTHFKTVEISGDLGSLRIVSLEAETLNVWLNLGDFSANTISVGNMEARLSLGSCTIEGITVSKSGTFTMNNGGLFLRNASINNLTASNNLGSIEYSGVLKGMARFELDLGALDIRLQNAEKDLSYTIRTDLGSININGRNYGSPARSNVSSPSCTLEIKTSLGSVTLNTK